MLDAARAAKDARRDALLHGRRVARRAQGRRSSTACSRWCAACASSAWRRASRSACSPTSRRERLAEAGLTAYNHNLDTSREFYGDDHHDPHLRRPPARRSRACARAGITVCCGGILGMGESIDDRCRDAGRRSRTSTRSRRACRSTRSSPVAGHAARRPAAGRAVRARAHDRDRAHRDAARARAPVARAARRSATKRRCCASSRARTRSSSATSCSPPATRSATRTSPCSSRPGCVRCPPDSGTGSALTARAPGRRSATPSAR